MTDNPFAMPSPKLSPSWGHVTDWYMPLRERKVTAEQRCLVTLGDGLWIYPGLCPQHQSAANPSSGFLATLTAWCEQQRIPYQGVPVGTWKRHACGKGNADKQAVIAAIRERGFEPEDDNEADAIAILLGSSRPGQAWHEQPRRDVPETRRQRRGGATYTVWRCQCRHGGPRRTLVGNARPCRHPGAGRSLPNRPEARAPCA